MGGVEAPRANLIGILQAEQNNFFAMGGTLLHDYGSLLVLRLRLI